MSVYYIGDGIIVLRGMWQCEGVHAGSSEGAYSSIYMHSLSASLSPPVYKFCYVQSAFVTNFFTCSFVFCRQLHNSSCKEGLCACVSVVVSVSECVLMANRVCVCL